MVPPGGYDLVGLVVTIRRLTTQRLPVPDSQLSEGSLSAGSALETHGLSSLAPLAGGRTGLNHPTGFRSSRHLPWGAVISVTVRTDVSLNSNGVIMGRRQLHGHRIESQSWSPGRHSGISERRAVIPTPSRDGEENIWLALPCLLKETQSKQSNTAFLCSALSERLGGPQLTVPHLLVMYTVALLGDDNKKALLGDDNQLVVVPGDWTCSVPASG